MSVKLKILFLFFFMATCVSGYALKSSLLKGRKFNIVTPVKRNQGGVATLDGEAMETSETRGLFGGNPHTFGYHQNNFPSWEQHPHGGPPGHQPHHHHYHNQHFNHAHGPECGSEGHHEHGHGNGYEHSGYPDHHHHHHHHHHHESEHGSSEENEETQTNSPVVSSSTTAASTTLPVYDIDVRFGP